MSIIVDFSPVDAQVIKEQADLHQVSIAEYIHDLTMNAVRKASELSEIDHRLEQVHNGHVVYKTMDELEAMAS